MATAYRVTQTAPPPPDDVHLILSHEEAETLQYIIGRIRGNDTRRGHSNAIWDALRKLGYRGNSVSGVWATGYVSFDRTDE